MHRLLRLLFRDVFWMLRFWWQGWRWKRLLDSARRELDACERECAALEQDIRKFKEDIVAEDVRELQRRGIGLMSEMP